MTYQFNFTAFQQSDILKPGDNSLSRGDSFTMPGKASTSICVIDNDSSLSGDSTYWNDKAGDTWGQQAQIEGAHGEMGTGGKIYAESYVWVQDQWGNKYVMLEIEQEGSGQDYFTFHTAYGMPLAGARLTVVSNPCDVQGDWVDYRSLGAGAKAEPLGSITGRMFVDSNHDNIGGSGEAGYDGAIVKLLDGHGNVVATTTTDQHGNYTFKDVAAGDYSVQFVEPDGYDFVKKDVGAWNTDSDADQGTGKTVQFHVGAGQNVCNIDAGVKEEPNAVIKGRLFVDSNHDNTEIDANHRLEAGYEGATVKLLDAHGNVVATTTTDADGRYQFDGLGKGNYTIQFDEPEGYGFVKQDQGDYRFDSDADVNTGKTVQICLTDDSTVCDVDAGLKPQTGTVTGTVFCDTDCDGKSAVTTTVPGDVIVVEAEHMERCWYDIKEGSQASGGKFVQLQTTSYWDDGYLKTDFSGATGTYDIALRVQDENDGNSTIHVYVNGHKIEAVRLDTGADGSGGAHGSFSTFVIKDVRIAKGDEVKLIADGNCTEFVRIDNLTFTGADKTVTTAEPTKAGVTINLLNAAGDIVATTQTDDHGTYTFDNVPVGHYKIMGIAPDGTEFTIQDVNGNSHDAIDSDVDAGGLSGTIKVVANGTSDIDLGVCEVKVGSLSGRYFIDANDNAVDDGEPGVAGVTVALLTAAGALTGITTTTAADGSYSFGDLAPGTYGVTFLSTPAGFALVSPNVGGDDAIDSDAVDAGMGASRITDIVVTAGMDTPDNDVGIADINDAPVAIDDMGKVCAGEMTTIDLLANDTDADDMVLAVTSISDDNETAGIGGTITLASGAVALLNADGTVSIDASNAARDLLVGDSLSDTFIYTVSDGELSDTGNVDLTVRGALNTYETLSADLGDVGVVTAQLTEDTTVGGDLFTLRVTAVEFGDSRLGDVLADIGDLDLTFCLSIATPIAQAPVSNDFRVSILTAESYSAAITGATRLPGADFGYNPQNIDNVNWLLNQADELLANGYTQGQIQRAVWNLVDGGADSLLTSSAANNYFNARPQFGDFATAQELTNLALANDGFVAQSGDLVAVLFDPVLDGVQPLVSAIEFDVLKENCDVFMM